MKRFQIKTADCHVRKDCPDGGQKSVEKDKTVLQQYGLPS